MGIDKHRKNESGQALVLILLSLAVVITIVLFVLSRSVTDISISDSESQSVSAFSAAEAGIEQALVIGTGSSSTIGDASYNATITNVATGLSQFVYPIELNSGDTMVLWLQSQDASPSFSGNTLRICWGRSGTSGSSATTPAIEASLFYQTTAGNLSTTRVARITADPYTTRTPSNSFTTSVAGQTIAGQAFAFCKVFDFTGLNNKQFVTVRMLYNTSTSQPIGFDSTSGGTLFPTQGITIDSSGTSGQSNRKVQVFQGWPEVPSVFLFGLYSQTGVTK